MTRTGEVSVYVAPQHQRTGIARRLLTLALETTPRAGPEDAGRLRVGAQRGEPAPVRDAGFERWGRLPRIAEIDGRAVDTIILGRHLEDGSNA